MGTRAAHPWTVDATANHPDAANTRVVDRWSERKTGYTISGVARRAVPAHRKDGDIVFSGFNQKTGESKTVFVPLNVD